MPLTKSKSPEAFKDNLHKELAAGKPKAQSLAIAYSVKRKAGGKDLYKALGKK
jgi:hypothetical protein